ncbi:hypothetical protein CF326_g9930, partial [Tilletia indica]
MTPLPPIVDMEVDSSSSPSKSKGAAPRTSQKVQRKLAEDIKIVANDLRATQEREANDQLLKRAYLGTFKLRIAADGNDRISVKHLIDQRGTEDKSDVDWIVEEITEHGRTAVFQPIIVAVYPDAISPSTNDSFIKQTGSRLPPWEYARQIVKGTDLHKSRTKFRYIPCEMSDRVWLELQPSKKSSEAGKDVIHLLDGQKRVKALRKLQASTTEVLQSTFAWIDAVVYDWPKIKDNQIVRNQLINNEVVKQNVSSPVDELRRQFHVYFEELERSFLRTSLASVRPKTSQEGRKRGQNEVLRD